MYLSSQKIKLNLNSPTLNSNVIYSCNIQNGPQQKNECTLAAIYFQDISIKKNKNKDRQLNIHPMLQHQIF